MSPFTFGFGFDAPAPPRGPSCGNGHGKPAGAANERGLMEFRYTSGAGRAGERQEQLDVRGRLLAHVQEAIRRASLPWFKLPFSLESWSILV